MVGCADLRRAGHVAAYGEAAQHLVEPLLACSGADPLRSHAHILAHGCRRPAP